MFDLLSLYLIFDDLLDPKNAKNVNGVSARWFSNHFLFPFDITPLNI